MKLDKHSSVPLYYQLKDLIIEKIEKNVYAPGTQIPSEMVFCEELDLSRPTVRQAIAELVSEGRLQIIKGKGTFVSSMSDRFEIKNFNGNTFSFLSSQKYSKDEIESYEIIKELEPEVERAFNQPSFKQDGYVRIRKILGSKSSVYAYIESTIPVALFPNLMSDIKNEKPMVDITVNKYAYLPSKSSNRLFVQPASQTEGRALEISRGTPVLVIFSRLLSRSENVCEVVVASLRSDICQLQF